jgi:hypothetical protein
VNRVRAYKPLSEADQAALDKPARALAPQWGNVYGSMV